MSSTNSVGLLIGYSNTNEDLYSRTIAQAYRHGRRLWDPDHALRQEANIWEKSRRDPEILHAMERRLAKVANVKRRVLPAREEHESDKKLSAIFEDIVGQVDKFTESARELAGAAFMGRTFAYINGRRRLENYADSGQSQWWVPTSLTDVRKERFRFISDITDGGKISRRLEMFSMAQHAWVDVLRPELFIKHVFNDEEGRLGWGRGLLEAIYYWHYSKQIVLREGLQGVARFAQGFLTVGVDGAREAGTGTPNTTVINEWLDVLEDAQGRHALAHDKADEVKMQPFPGQGNAAAIEWCKYFDEGMAKLITGSIRPTGGGEGGSYARSETEADASEELMQHDRTILDETLTRDLLGLIFNLNRGTIYEMGLGDARCPKFDSTQQWREDPETAANVIATISPVMELLAEEAYEKIGFSVPQPGQKTIGGAPSDPFGSGGTGGVPSLEETMAKHGIEGPGNPGSEQPNNLPPPDETQSGPKMAAWDESKHPRADDGKFGEGGGGSSGKSATPTKKAPEWRKGSYETYPPEHQDDDQLKDRGIPLPEWREIGGSAHAADGRIVASTYAYPTWPDLTPPALPSGYADPHVKKLSKDQAVAAQEALYGELEKLGYPRDDAEWGANRVGTSGPKKWVEHRKMIFLSGEMAHDIDRRGEGKDDYSGGMDKNPSVTASYRTLKTINDVVTKPKENQQ